MGVVQRLVTVAQNSMHFVPLKDTICILKE
ncbi:MAG: hypothetical protein QOJ95_4150 [Mycobacterium sp.]|jgi:hypothetical protein|nr:hypothetical protein [Mycobacterium sp.]MDT5179952.1 hypothetical protein [Mycobacterium sp.]